jgi:hypothetical protein
VPQPPPAPAPQFLGAAPNLRRIVDAFQRDVCDALPRRMRADALYDGNVQWLYRPLLRYYECAPNFDEFSAAGPDILHVLAFSSRAEYADETPTVHDLFLALYVRMCEGHASLAAAIKNATRLRALLAGRRMDAGTAAWRTLGQLLTMPSAASVAAPAPAAPAAAPAGDGSAPDVRCAAWWPCASVHSWSTAPHVLDLDSDDAATWMRAVMRLGEVPAAYARAVAQAPCERRRARFAAGALRSRKVAAARLGGGVLVDAGDRDAALREWDAALAGGARLDDVTLPTHLARDAAEAPDALLVALRANTCGWLAAAYELLRHTCDAQARFWAGGDAATLTEAALYAVVARCSVAAARMLPFASRALAQPWADALPCPSLVSWGGAWSQVRGCAP